MDEVADLMEKVREKHPAGRIERSVYRTLVKIVGEQEPIEVAHMRSENGGWWLYTVGYGRWVPSREVERIEKWWHTE